MTRKQTGVALMAVLLLVSGCATVSAEGYRQKVSTLNGTHVDALMLDWGIPDRVERREDGSQVLTFHKIEVGYGTGRQVGVGEGVEVNRTQVDGGDVLTDVRHYDIPLYGPAERYETPCDTVFTVGADHLVKAVAFDGPGCVAKEEKSKSAS